MFVSSVFYYDTISVVFRNLVKMCYVRGYEFHSMGNRPEDKNLDGYKKEYLSKKKKLLLEIFNIKENQKRKNANRKHLFKFLGYRNFREMVEGSASKDAFTRDMLNMTFWDSKQNAWVHIYHFPDRQKSDGHMMTKIPKSDIEAFFSFFHSYDSEINKFKVNHLFICVATFNIPGESRKEGVEYFKNEELMVRPEERFDHYHHRLMTQEESKKIISMYGGNPTQFPKIYTDDPIIKMMDWGSNVGQLVNMKQYYNLGGSVQTNFDHYCIIVNRVGGGEELDIESEYENPTTL